MELLGRNFLGLLVLVLFVLVLGRTLVSWVDPFGRRRISAFLIQATEPILAPIRRALPPAGMFDFSTLVVLLVLGALVRVLL